jgi:hypothetical protein
VFPFSYYMSPRSVSFDFQYFLQGDDAIDIISTDPRMHVSIYGGLGSDTFTITPKTVDPVVSKNLRGHRGIIEHKVVSVDDEGYDKLAVRGIEVNVLDNDGQFGWICNVNQEGVHIMTEDGEGEFSFFLYPTSVPDDDLYINIEAPGARDGNCFVMVNDVIIEHLHWVPGNMEPQEVHVKYNSAVMKLDNTEVHLILKLLVNVNDGATKDSRFISTEQSILPVDCATAISLQHCWRQIRLCGTKPRWYSNC